MEEDRESRRYWCHECETLVFPVLGIQTVKCSSCNGEFIEEVYNARIRRTRIEFHEDEEDDNRGDLDHEVMLRRRRQRSAMIIRSRARFGSESENNGDRQRVILINPFNQTIIVQGGGDGGGAGVGRQTHPIGSLGDYFSGPGLELLLQHLSENDPNRYGTPPAKKDAIEAMPTVTVDEHEPSVQCSVCLDDFEPGIEAKQMPCKHMFHTKCILPWLELHSSCPICRFELPCDESKLHQEGESENAANNRQFSVSLPWPFSSIFSSATGSEIETGSSVTSTSDSLPAPHETHGEEDNH